MGYWKDMSEFILTVSSILAICFSGCWTYIRFVRHRLIWPNSNVDLTVNDTILSDGKRLVHVEFKIMNKGSTIIKPTYAEMRLRKMVPIPEDIVPEVNAGNDPVCEGETEISWPLVYNREWTWESGEFEIEPCETDSLHADFFIEADISVCQFYAFLRNPKKKRNDLGWTVTKIHTFDQGGHDDARKQVSETPSAH